MSMNQTPQQPWMNGAPAIAATMTAPRPLAVTKRLYKLSVVKDFLDLEKLVKKNRKAGSSDIRADVDYLQPCLTRGLRSREEALKKLIKKNGGPSQCRLLYITRHAESEHNLIATQRGKKESFAVLGHYREDRDPKLTDLGVSQAFMAGEAIATSKAGKYALPVETHTSSLWRCIQTATYSLRGYKPQDKYAKVCISDDWREWKGTGIYHVSDGRTTKTELLCRLDGLSLNDIPRPASLVGSFGKRDSDSQSDSLFNFSKKKLVDFDVGSLTEEDDAFNEPETFINVDIRMERALARLFEEDEDKNCFHIVTHGRATQSLLRLLGFQRDPSWEPIEKYRVWDFDNGATVALLVRCEPRSRLEIDGRFAYDQKLQREEYDFINQKYQQDVEEGFLAIQANPITHFGKLRWADEIEKLKKEAEKSEHVGWRHKLLTKACEGDFRRGDFRVRSSGWNELPEDTWDSE